MRTWRAKIVEFLDTWRDARYKVRVAKAELRDQEQAEELQRAREGVDRFPPPPMGSAGGI